MKNKITIIEIIVILFILIIIGLIATIIVSSVIKNIQKDQDLLLIDNYVNNILYSKEKFMKENDNNIPKYCNTSNEIVYYDENYNNQYDSNELLCKKDCNDETCIKYFITQNNNQDEKIKCNKIIIEDNYIEINNCFINNKEIKNYKYIKNY